MPTDLTPKEDETKTTKPLEMQSVCPKLLSRVYTMCFVLSPFSPHRRRPLSAEGTAYLLHDTAGRWKRGPERGGGASPDMFSWGQDGIARTERMHKPESRTQKRVRANSTRVFLFYFIFTALFVRNRDCLYPPSPPLLSLAHRGVGVLYRLPSAHPQSEPVYPSSRGRGKREALLLGARCMPVDLIQTPCTNSIFFSDFDASNSFGTFDKRRGTCR